LKSTVAAKCAEEKLGADERVRNAPGKVYCYKYDVSCTDNVESPNQAIGLPPISGSHSSVSIIQELESSTIPFKPELIPGTQIPYPGFPSLNVLPIAAVELTPIGLNCFGSASKYPNTVLTLHQMPEMPALEVLAANVIGKSLFVNWPMMHEGLVVAISNETKEIRLVKGKQNVNEFNVMAADRWAADSEAMRQMYHSGNGVPGAGGVQINEVKIRLKLVPLQGMKTNPANGSTKKQFGKEEADVPLQLALWQAPAPDPRFIERGPMTLEDRFPEGCNIVLTKGKYRGCTGVVAGVADKKLVGVKVQTYPPELPFGLAIARSVQESFISSSDAARILKMNPGLFGKVTGRLQFEQGKYDLGLNLKAADGTCVVGYTRKRVDNSGKRRSEGDGKSAWSAGDAVLVVGSARAEGSDDRSEERIQWEYTPKAIRLIEEYKRKFPQLFSMIQKNPNEKRYDANKVFGPNGEAWLPVIREWLNNHESARLPRSPVTTNSMSYEAIGAVQKAADVRSLALKKSGYPKESLVKVPGSALCREGSIGPTDVINASDLNNNDAPELGDRVVNICEEGIPFGAKGTVVAVHEAASTGSVEVVMDTECIGGTNLQGSCANFRGKLCVWAHLLKIAPENSMALVDKLVPKGTGRAAVEKILATIERDTDVDKTPQDAHMQSSLDSQVDAGMRAEPSPARNTQSAADEPGWTVQQKPQKVSASPARPSQQKGRKASTSPARSSSSTGRGVQKALWKEARKPDEKGIGFKGKRKGSKTGFNRWKSIVASSPAPISAVKTPSTTGGSAAELKAMLGVGASPSAPKAPANGEVGKLKAMLGVKSPSVAAPVPAAATPDATAGLKAILGVNDVPQPQRQVLAHQTGPVTAADKLMQLMSQQQPSPGPGPNMMYPQGSGGPPGRPNFNFTYVEEGKEPPMPHHVMSPPAHGYPPMNYPMMAGMPPIPPHGVLSMQPMMPMPMQTYGGPPPPHMYPPHGPPAEQFPPLGSSGPSVDQFPPLGSKGNPVLASPPPSAAPTPKKPVEETKKEEIKPVNFLMPSVVAAKTRR